MNQSKTTLPPSMHVKYEMFIPLSFTERCIHVTTAAMEKQ